MNQAWIAGMGPEAKCRCRHFGWMHELKSDNDLLKNAEKYCESHNGVCGVRECSCSGFTPAK